MGYLLGASRLYFMLFLLQTHPIVCGWQGGVGGIPCVCVYICTLSRFSCAQLFAAPWPVVHQVPWSMGFSRQEYCSGLPCPPPGHLPNPGVEPTSLTSPSLAGRFFTTTATYIPQSSPNETYPQSWRCSLSLFQPRLGAMNWLKGWDGGWEGGSREKGYMYTCDWSTLFYSRN